MLSNNLKSLGIHSAMFLLVFLLQVFYWFITKFEIQGTLILLLSLAVVYIILGFLFLNPKVKYGILSTSSVFVALFILYVVIILGISDTTTTLASFYNFFGSVLYTLVMRFYLPFYYSNKMRNIIYLSSIWIPSVLLYIGILLKRIYLKHNKTS